MIRPPTTEMDDVTSTEALPGRRHIIKRPRLTRLLDECEARVILLVAPAGYGKTTLAREWLSSAKERAWYSGSASSTDIAALALAICDALESVSAEARDAIAERLKASQSPEKDARALAVLIGDAVRNASAPPPVLGIDDYHLLAASHASERFVEELWRQTDIRLLIASRARPSWVNARRLLYGEVFEIGRTLLAMDADEAASVLRGRNRGAASGLVALADGWPAVIGLAAVASALELPDDVVAGAIYDFLAEEVFRSLDAREQAVLAALAIAPRLKDEVIGNAVREDTADAAVRLLGQGLIFRPEPTLLEMHPLLRDFITEKIRGHPAEYHALVDRLGRLLVTDGDWDTAFALADAAGAESLIVRLLDKALDVMLQSGRAMTVERWATTARSLGSTAGVVSFALAELAFRRGDFVLAESLGLEAARATDAAAWVKSRGVIRAAQAAYFTDQPSAVDLAEKGAQLARSPTERRQALWVQFLAAVGHDYDAAAGFLTTFETLAPLTLTDELRLEAGRLIAAERWGPLDEPLEHARRKIAFLDQVGDALVRSSFLAAVARVEFMCARYTDSWNTLRRAEREIRKAHLTFAVPQVRLARVAALVGLARYGDAQRLIGELAESARADPHVDINVRIQAARLALSQSDPTRAVELLRDAEGVGDTPTRGEALAYRALARAAAGDRGRASEDASAAQRVSATLEAQAVALLAIAATSASSSRRDAIETGFVYVTTNGARDPLLIAARSHKTLRLAAEAQRDSPAAQALREAEAESISGTRTLSRREREVHELLAKGMTNREIARTLYISDVTVKVHVRHIFQKLGVRTRAEAATRVSG